MKIIIKNLNKYYGKKHVLKNINLTLDNGVYGLIGPNGVGKTTFLHILLSLLEFDCGEILIEDNIVFGSDEFVSKIGYLPQYPTFYPSFTAYDFLSYMCVLKGVEKKNINNKVIDLLQSVNLLDQKRKKIESFSGGMKQRLGIAQALINDPELLILDEPTAGLDPKERIRFRNIIAKLSKNKIIIFSSHIISDIEYIADKIILLKDGKIIQESSQIDLLEQIHNSVQEIIVPSNKLDILFHKLQIIRIHKETYNSYRLRIISDETLGDIVPPDIEDIYMYYFGEENERNDIL